jgi:hypothetical protein
MAEADSPADVAQGGTQAAQAGIARARRPIPEAWLAEIETRILRAEAPADFVPDLARQFGRHKRKVWDYVARVRARLAERAKAHDPEADREQIRALLLRAYRTAEIGGEKGPDAKGMVAAAKTLADVTGVMSPKKLDVTSGGSKVAAVFILPALEPLPDPPAGADAPSLAPGAAPGDHVGTD